MSLYFSKCTGSWIARQRNDDVHPHVYLVIYNPQLEYISIGRFWVLPTMAMVYSRLIPDHKKYKPDGVWFNGPKRRDRRCHRWPLAGTRDRAAQGKCDLHTEHKGGQAREATG
jgi:hypothetical protein